MSAGHRPRDTGPIDTAKLTPLNVPSAGRRPTDAMESTGDGAMSEIVIANLRRELAQWRREAGAWKGKHDALRAAAAPAEAARVTPTVEATGVVTDIGRDGSMRIVLHRERGSVPVHDTTLLGERVTVRKG